MKLVLIFFLILLGPAVSALGADLSILYAQRSVEFFALDPLDTLQTSQGIARPSSVSLCRGGAPTFVPVVTRSTWVDFNRAYLSAMGVELRDIPINSLLLNVDVDGSKQVHIDIASFEAAQLSRLLSLRHKTIEEDLSDPQSDGSLNDAVTKELLFLQDRCSYDPRNLFKQLRIWKNDDVRRSIGTDKYYIVAGSRGAISSDLITLPNSPYLVSDSSILVSVPVEDGRPETLLRTVEQHIKYWQTVRETRLYNWEDLYFLERAFVQPVSPFFSEITSPPAAGSAKFVGEAKSLLETWQAQEQLWLVDLDTAVGRHLERLEALRIEGEALLTTKNWAVEFTREYANDLTWSYASKASLPEELAYRADNPGRISFTSDADIEAWAKKQYDLIQLVTVTVDGPGTGVSSLTRTRTVTNLNAIVDWALQDQKLWRRIEHLVDEPPASFVSEDFTQASERSLDQFRACLQALFASNTRSPDLLAALADRSVALQDDLIVEDLLVRVRNVFSRADDSVPCAFGDFYGYRDAPQRIVDYIATFGDQVIYSDYTAIVAFARFVEEVDVADQNLHRVAEALDRPTIAQWLKTGGSTEIDLADAVVGIMLDEVFTARRATHAREEYRSIIPDVGYWDGSGLYQLATPSESSFTYLAERAEVRIEPIFSVTVALNGDPAELRVLEALHSSNALQLYSISSKDETIAASAERLSDCGVRISSVSRQVAPEEAVIGLEIDQSCREFNQLSLPYSSSETGAFARCGDATLVETLPCVDGELKRAFNLASDVDVIIAAALGTSLRLEPRS